jgi:hypothetical protein
MASDPAKDSSASKTFADLQAEQGVTGMVDPESLAIGDLSDEERAAFVAQSSTQADATIARIRAKCADMKEPGASFFDPFAATVIEQIIDGTYPTPVDADDLDRRIAAHKEAREKLVELETRVFDAESALAELVRLKDGPRDEAYELPKRIAWSRARAVLAQRHTIHPGGGHR